MSNYVNFSVPGQDSATVAAALKALGRKAFVAPTVDGITMFYDAAADEQDAKVITDLAAAASKALGAPVLAALNHDDDILQLWLVDGGAVADSYNSAPGYFDDSKGDKPTGGNAAALCRACGGAGDAVEVEAILRASSDIADDSADDADEADDYVFATDRHVALADVLGLPADYVVLTYASVSEETDIPGRSAFLEV